MRLFRKMLVLLAAAAMTQAQTRPRSVVGTVTALKAETAELLIRTDSGESAAAQLSSDTQVQRVAPGQTSLKDAETAAVTDIAAGDRILVTFLPDSSIARRVVLMTARDITKRNEADRMDWRQRGVSGLVASRKDGLIVLRIRSLMAETTATVRTGEGTKYRRYAAGSVRFADARPSSFAEIREGDQLCARGVKSEDGSSVTAEEVVFGTFVTKAGEIVSVEQGRIRIKETGTGQPLTVSITADAQLKRLPEFGGGPGGMGPGGMGPGGGVRFGGPGGPMGPGGPPPGGPGPGAQGGPRPDLSQMFERLPSVPAAELKPGDSVVFSSTVGSRPNEFTAIMLVSNASGLIRMATMRQQQQQSANRPGGGMGVGGFLDFPTMMP